jgi:ATP-dependent exoDNAse (exonuclease V) beta subunit
VSNERALLLADAEARDEALDTGQSFIVQAPAGSGKTELLIQRYLKLLGEAQNPEEVLAITFTRKAAAEMRQRVIASLLLARANSEPKEAHRKLTFELARTVLARDELHDWKLIETPRRLQIQTLDALNAAIARSLPLSSGLGGAVQTVTDDEARVLYRGAATATLDWLTTDDRMNGVVECVLSHLDHNTALYVAHISRMLENRDQWLLFVGSGSNSAGGGDTASARRLHEEAIEQLITVHLEQARQAFPVAEITQTMGLVNYAAACLRAEGLDSHALYSLDGSNELPRTDAAGLHAWQAIAELFLKQRDGWRKMVNKAQGFPAGDSGQKKAMTELLQRLSSEDELLECLERIRILPDPRYSDEQWEVLVALIDLLPYAVAELERQFSNQGVTDHIEIARAAAAALGSVDEPGDIALMLDHSIRHLLIDEMQDTSIGQYHLLEILIAGWEADDGRTLFCVGDPMQSIYRFRDADVSRFLSTRREGIGELKPKSLLLRRNFRSGELLVHWFNTVFCQLMPLDDEPLTGGISYADSVPVEQQAGLGECRVHPLFDASATDEAEYCAGLIQQCLAEDPDRNTAVLVQSRTQLPLLLSQLRLLDIDYQAIEIDRLVDMPEIIEITALTRALCHDGDRLAWLALLRGPCVALTWQDLHALVVNDAHRTVPDILTSAGEGGAVSADGLQRIGEFLTIIAPFRKHTALCSLRERIERAWYALGGPALLDTEDELENVYRYLEVLEKIEQAGTLEDVTELTARLEQERVSSIAGDTCRVQIMTMHKAKGLQFDNVILYGLGRSTAGSRKAVLNWLYLPDASGKSEMIVSPIGARSEIEHDPLHRFIDTMETDKDRAELDRLLYVACTRAIHSLHLVGHVNIAPRTGMMRPPRKGSLLHRLWPALEHEFATNFAAHEPSSEPMDDDGSWLQTPGLRRLDRSSFRLQPPRLAPVPSRSQSSTGGDRPVDYYWVGSAARYAGTVVHKFLQKLATRDIDVRDTDVISYREDIRSRVRALGASDSELEQICERVERSLRGILEDEKGRWILRGEGETEFALTGQWKGGVESIVIDRVRVDDDGVHWLVDYKTSTHEGGDLPGFLQHEEERYRAQLEKYVGIYRGLVDAPVKAALYFPLLRVFREMDLPLDD